MSESTTHELKFNGAVLSRGFWFYVWEITTSDGSLIYYVGRTGDSSSSNAQSPFARMGQHLGFNANSNVLRRHLEAKGFRPEKCSFRLISHGPILEESASQDDHRNRRDSIAALEKALADAMKAAGYTMLNAVACKKSLDSNLFENIRSAFALQFPKLVWVR
jgi:hypothetical protein